MKINIPSEILFQIFRYLTQDDLKHYVSLTCKQWYEVVQGFSLVKYSVQVESPLNYHFAKLLQDAKKSPAFSHNIKKMIMKDQSVPESYDKNQSFYYDFGVDTLHQIIQLCPNLSELKIVLRSIDAWNKFEEMFICDDSLIKSQIKLFELKFDEKFVLGEDSFSLNADPPTLFEATLFEGAKAFDLVKLTSTTSLCELIIGETEYSLTEPLVFVKDSWCISKNYFLTTIKIVCPRFGMTKACLEYIISGHLIALQNLDLCMVIVDNIDENGTVFNMIDADVNTIFHQFKQFCLRDLENYNIALADMYETCVFASDNCENEEESYSKRYLDYYNEEYSHFEEAMS
ncbi:unnamed protein product [Mucor hiemalis]